MKTAGIRFAGVLLLTTAACASAKGHPDSADGAAGFGGTTAGTGGTIGTHAAAPNALDRIDFGNLGTDTTSESAHQMKQLVATSGVGAAGQTYRVIAPSSTAPGDPSQNAVLTFTLVCGPKLQTYVTVKLWGGDTTQGVIYLYDSTRGYEIANYHGQSIPEIDIQEDSTPMAPGRFVYVTMPIPLAATQGKTSVTLTLNAARSFSYYDGRTTTQLAAGQTSRHIYSAFSHTDPMLNLFGDDLQMPAAAAVPTPLTFDAAYVTATQQRFANRIDRYRDATQDSGLWVQAWGTAWDSAVKAGTVPAQVIGLFMGAVTPTDNRMASAWLDLAATYMSTGNNNPMLRLDDLSQAFAHNLAPIYFQSSEIRQRVIAGLDAAFFMQSRNGAFGSLPKWVGLGATTATTNNPQGRVATNGNAIEGNGTLALGSAFINLFSDSTFLGALDADISALVPGIKRYQAYGQMQGHRIILHRGEQAGPSIGNLRPRRRACAGA